MAGPFPPIAAVLDDFNRADENPLSDGGNWAAVTGISQCKVLSSAAAGTTWQSSDSQWSLLTLSDAEAIATVAVLPGEIADDFNRVQNPIGSGWTGVSGVAQCQANGSQMAGTTSTSSLSLWGISAADIEVWATLAVMAGTGNGMGCIARSDGTSQNYYFAHYQQGVGVRLFKVVGGTQTQLGSTVAVTLAAGDEIKIKCSGTTIEAWYFSGGAWTNAVSVTDTSLSTGKVGALIRGTTGRLDDFSHTDADSLGVYIRGDGSSSGYVAQARNNSILLGKLSSGLVTLGTYAVTLGVGDQVAVQAVGNAISASTTVMHW